jgi:SAM-dependent methyltransferase
LPARATVGIDIDAIALHDARVNERLLPVVANLWTGELPVRTGAVDVAVAGEILEHVPFADELLREVARVLRPEGVLIGSVPNAFRIPNRVAFALGRDFEKDPTHLRHFSISGLRQALTASFSDVAIRPCVGRFTPLAPRLLANDLVWRATGPLP